MKLKAIKTHKETKQFEQTLKNIGFYETKRSAEEKECAQMLFDLGYFEK